MCKRPKYSGGVPVLDTYKVFLICTTDLIPILGYESEEKAKAHQKGFEEATGRKTIILPQIISR